jgi:hypothetical protein
MRVLSCEMTEEQKQEFCKIHNLDMKLLEDNCPCQKDENGVAIFPKAESLADQGAQNIESLQQTVSQLTAHLAKMTDQINALTKKLNS